MKDKEKRQQKVTDKPTVVPQLERIRSSHFITVYSDDTAMAVNPLGMKLFFGNIADVKEGKVVIEQEVCVCMSPEHAYNLQQLLERQLEKYQKTFGPLRAMPETVEVSSTIED